MNRKSLVLWGVLAVLLMALAACQPVVMPVVPTRRTRQPPLKRLFCRPIRRMCRLPMP